GLGNATNQSTGILAINPATDYNYCVDHMSTTTLIWMLQISDSEEGPGSEDFKIRIGSNRPLQEDALPVLKEA
ncbi:MAG: hypothetical protein WAV78_49320, partial [Xanthobacteraceae bacterium]